MVKVRVTLMSRRQLGYLPFMEESEEDLSA